MEEGNEDYRLFRTMDLAHICEGKNTLEQAMESYHKLGKRAYDLSYRRTEHILHD